MQNGDVMGKCILLWFELAYYVLLIRGSLLIMTIVRFCLSLLVFCYGCWAQIQRSNAY